MSTKTLTLAIMAAAALAAGCASQNELLAQRQQDAVQTALTRARFEMNRPDAAATVLSQDYISRPCRARG